MATGQPTRSKFSRKKVIFKPLFLFLDSVNKPANLFIFCLLHIIKMGNCARHPESFSRSRTHTMKPKEEDT